MYKLIVICTSFLVCIDKSYGKHLLGSYVERNVNDEDVVKAGTFASGALCEKFSSPYLSKLVSVKKAQSQVVAGKNYKLLIVMGFTNCNKSEVDCSQSKTCELQDSQNAYCECEVKVYADLQGNLTLKDFTCGTC